MDAEIQKKLREKFDTARIGLKPKITCGMCSKSQSKACDKHPKAKCTSLRGEPGCGQWLTPQHMHIEFVSHADVTDRLLEVDPEWTWEPVALAPNGLPALTPDGGLWIRLTVAGVTRIGYGGADGKTGDDGVKEAVSDAIKVTAMRFGVALDLWRKSEVSGKPSDEAPPIGSGQPPAQRTNGQQQRPAAPAAQAPANRQAGTNGKPGPADAARAFLRRKCDTHGYQWPAVSAKFAAQYEGANLEQESDPNRITAFAKLLDGMPSAELGAPAEAGTR